MSEKIIEFPDRGKERRERQRGEQGDASKGHEYVIDSPQEGKEILHELVQGSYKILESLKDNFPPPHSGMEEPDPAQILTATFEKSLGTCAALVTSKDASTEDLQRAIQKLVKEEDAARLALNMSPRSSE